MRPKPHDALEREKPLSHYTAEDFEPAEMAGATNDNARALSPVLVAVALLALTITAVAGIVMGPVMCPTRSAEALTVIIGAVIKLSGC